MKSYLWPDCSIVAWEITEGTPYELTRNNNQNNVTRYGYDDLNRLTDLDWLQNSNTFNARHFAYNRASQVQSVSTANHDLLYKGNHNLKGNWVSNGLNQHSSINGVTHNYDLNGNLTSDGTTTYVYDVENRLASGTKNLTLTYDPMGRLHTTTAAGTNTANITTTYLYSGDALVAEYVGSTMTKRYVHGNGIDNPLVGRHGSTTGSANRYYLHSDHQGSIVGISNSAGTITALNTYDSFGIPHQTNQGRFSYTGQIYLPELVMYHYKARVYNPKLGRFLQTDPVGYDDQMNLYAYVANDPMSYIDPTGKRKILYAGNPEQKSQLKSMVAKVKDSDLILNSKISQLENSDNTHIVDVQGSGSMPSNIAMDAENASNGTGTGSVTKLSLNDVTLPDGSLTSSPEAVAAHELAGHAANVDQGIANANDQTFSAEQNNAIDMAMSYRDSFTMPQHGYALIEVTKLKLMKEDILLNKGKILRAGMHALQQMSVDELPSVAKKVEKIKVGRPRD